MKLLVEMEATGEADTAAEAATVDTWLLVKELGVGNIVEESYEDETVAREMAASLFCSWVLFYLPAASDAALVELLFGGVGFSHGAVRRHPEEPSSPTSVATVTIAKPASAPPTSPLSAADKTLFVAYVRSVWLLQAATQCYGGSSVGGFFGQMNGVLLILVLLTSVSASRELFAAVTLVRTAIKLHSMPFIWEVELWAVLMDLTMLAASCSVERAQAAVRAQMVAFYAGAAFWKINTSFLDPTTSCSTIFFAQLLAAYAPASLVQSSALASLLRALAPAAALGVELAVPILLATWRRCGFALALIFHLLVVLTPPPNNAGGFSVCAAQYLFFFVPEGVALALEEIKSGQAARLVACAAFCTSIGCAVGRHPFFFDTAPPVYALQLTLLGRALWLSPPPLAAAAAPSSKEDNVVVVGRGDRPPLSVKLPLLAAVVYAFVLPLLGVMDQMAPNMFSNQRFHAGSNHLIVPTGVLHTALGPGAFSVVRVTYTTSKRIGAQYPAEVTASLSPAARQLLQDVGHSGRQWNPMLGRVIGLMAVAGPVGSATPAQYTMPAIELRRLIGEAQADGESFEVHYTRLEEGGGGGASSARGTRELWRTKSAGQTAVYRWNAATGTASCTSGGPPRLTSKACAVDEPVMLPPPSRLALWLMAFQPLPVLSDEAWSEVHCYGP